MKFVNKNKSIINNVDLPLWIKYKHHSLFFILSILSGVIGCFLVSFSMPDVVIREKTNILLFIMYIIGFMLNIASSKLCSIYMKIKYKDNSYYNQIFDSVTYGFIITLSYSLISFSLELQSFKIITILIGFIFFYAIPISIEKV